jgi:hypothetical protein
MKFLDRLGKGVTSVATKRPVLTAGAVGVGIGAANSADSAERLERKLMHNTYGDSKYSSCPLMSKFAEKRLGLAARLPFEKVAEGGPPGFASTMTGGLAQGIGAQTGRESVGGIRALLGHAFQAMKEVFFVDPKREKMVQQITETDPVVKTHEREQPGTIQQAYKTMARFAPTLSTDPNLATSFLRNAAMSGGALDYQVVKGLADAEAAVQKARNEGAWLRKGF